MTRIITIPLVVLLLSLAYVAFEVPILSTLSWISGDGLVNWFSIGRLQEREKLDEILALCESPHAKTRYFALQAAVEMGNRKVLAPRIRDQDWEVRMRAIELSKLLSHKESGPNVVDRIRAYTPMEATARQAFYEQAALLEAMPAVSSRLNAESVAELALTTGEEPIYNAARATLWGLGPLAEAEKAYLAFLEKPEEHRARMEDVERSIAAAAALRVDGAIEHAIRYVREGGGPIQLAAIAALGTLGGDKAKTMLAPIARDPGPGAFETPFDKERRDAAKLALARIEARAKGRPEPTSLEDTRKPAEDLLAGYSKEPTQKPPEATRPPTPAATKAATAKPVPATSPATPAPSRPAPAPTPPKGEPEEDDLLKMYGGG